MGIWINIVITSCNADDDTYQTAPKASPPLRFRSRQRDIFVCNNFRFLRKICPPVLQLEKAIVLFVTTLQKDTSEMKPFALRPFQFACSNHHAVKTWWCINSVHYQLLMVNIKRDQKMLQEHRLWEITFRVSFKQWYIDTATLSCNNQ